MFELVIFLVFALCVCVGHDLATHRWRARTAELKAWNKAPLALPTTNSGEAK